MSAYNNGDYVEAVNWFRKAAEQGLATAQYGLKVRAFPRSYGETVLWLRKAAEQGFSEAQNVLEQLGY